jgi:hypothetical protein
MNGETMQFDDKPNYDPELDEPRYSKRDVEELTSDLAKNLSRECFLAGRAEALKEIVAMPLIIEGRWTPDTVYQPRTLVYHASQQWLSMVETASEPSGENAFWRCVDFPHVNVGGRDR